MVSLKNKSGIPVIVVGAMGKMGSTISARASEISGVRLLARLDRAEAASGDCKAVGNPYGVGVTGILDGIKADLGKNEKPVLIDFTSPEATLSHLQAAVTNNWAIVIGTTGFSSEQKKIIESAAKKIPIVLSPNMSVGVNTLFRLAAEAARILGEPFDIEVFEAHHRLKKDAPSGTAVKLAEVVAAATGRSYPQDIVFHREGLTGPRTQKEIGMQVIRGGDIVGEHTVYFCGMGERVEIKHVATSRNTFADGALRAAAWLAGQKPGLYDMGDVLGIR